MLQTLSLRQDLSYYACEDHFEVEAYSRGKRHHWVEDAQLNVTAEDIVIDRLITEAIQSDHRYARDCETEDIDYSEDALDLDMGSDFFNDSQTISLREEVIENERVFLEVKQMNNCIFLFFVDHVGMRVLVIKLMSHCKIMISCMM